MQQILTNLFAEAKYLEGLSNHRALAHRDNCRWWDNVNLGLGIPAVVVAAAAGTSALAEVNRLIPGLLGLAAASLSGLLAFLNPSQNARLHAHASTLYGELSGHFRRFHDIDIGLGGSPQELRSQLETLVGRLNEVDEGSPWILRRYQRRHGLGLYAPPQPAEPEPASSDATEHV